MRFCLVVVALAFVAQLAFAACSSARDCQDIINTVSQYERSYQTCFGVTCFQGYCSQLAWGAPTADRCTRQQCTKDMNHEHIFYWKNVSTEEAAACVSDACYSRECNATIGCVETEICASKSTECFTLTCNNQTHQCTNSSNLVKEGCWTKICVNDKIERVGSCPSLHCKNARCLANGTCEYTPESPPEDDPCLNYTCSEETGAWSSTPKCASNGCQIGSCTIFGECKYRPRDCYEEVNVSGEDTCTFRLACVEKPTAPQGYQCVRQFTTGNKSNVCGVCIPDNETDYKNLTAFENACYKIFCGGEIPIIHRAVYKANDGCFNYDCDNNTGLNYTVVCNSGEKQLICTDGKCLSLSEAMGNDYAVEFVINNLDFDTFKDQYNTILEEIGNVSNQDTSSFRYGVEFKEGNLTTIELFVDDGNTANIVADAMKDLINKTSCNAGIICRLESVEAKSPSSVNGVTSVHQCSAIAFMLMALAIVMNLF